MVSLDQIVSLCKRRGFIFPGSEIYGGLANTWDYGPYGVELKNNLKKIWWKYWVADRSDIVGLDSAILMNPRTWEASGHIESFNDPLMDCRECKSRERADKLIENWWEEKRKAGEFTGHENSTTVFNPPKPNNWAGEKTPSKDLFEFISHHKIACPICKKVNWTEPKNFNLMFKTQQGVVEEHQRDIYLRPETAQGIFVNFKNVLNSTRGRLPFGIAQIGKSFRNEITPGNFTFRTREFEQMEVEYFCHSKDWKDIFTELEKNSLDFFLALGIKKENLRWREHDKKELSHYSKLTKDIEYQYPWGWGELEGLAYRTDFDLQQHQKFSGENLEYLDPVTNEKFIPHVIEPSFGCDRTVLTILLNAYDEEEVKDEKRTVLRFTNELAPIKVAILPLSKKENLNNEARKIFDLVRSEFRTEYDDTQSIGKRYRRQDEIGTPLCVTVDFGTIGEDEKQGEKNTVTIRERDSMEQIRIPVKKLVEILKEKLGK